MDGQVAEGGKHEENGNGFVVRGAGGAALRLRHDG